MESHTIWQYQWIAILELANNWMKFGIYNYQYPYADPGISKMGGGGGGGFCKIGGLGSLPPGGVQRQRSSRSVGGRCPPGENLLI